MTPQEEQKYENRFDRIEGKLDKLVEIVTSLARVEEQLVAQNRRVDHIESKVDSIERDVDNIAELARANNFAVKFADKLFWIVVTAIVGLVIYTSIGR